MEEYLVKDKLRHNQVPYMPGETVEMNPAQAEGLVKAGILELKPKPVVEPTPVVEVIQPVVVVEPVVEVAETQPATKSRRAKGDSEEGEGE